MKKYIFYCLVVCCWCTNTYAQDFIEGRVIDSDNQVLIGASVFWSNNPGGGVSADFNGNFKIALPATTDTLVCSYIGFESFKIAQSDITTPIQIQLSQGFLMQTIEISASRSITPEFSSMTLEKMDVYLNPVAAGDPLKAVALLPASTNTDETANPSLRGASANFSTILLNGVPLVDPVKASALNGIGYFSLINTEMVGEMTVYPSNPPLYVGNSIGGLVDIRTTDQQNNLTTDIAISAANIGIFSTHHIKGEDNYLQVYANRQFSDFFKAINGDRFDFLTHFSNTDMGINTSFSLGEGKTLKYVGYAINEKNSTNIGTFNYKGEVSGKLFRNYHILNYSQQKENLLFDYSFGFDHKHNENQFGALSLNQRYNNFFLGTNMSKYWDNNTVLKVGAAHRQEYFSAHDIHPPYYANFGAVESPLKDTIQGDKVLSNPEIYAFLKHEKNKWDYSYGVRLGGVFADNTLSNPYVSAQVNAKYTFNKYADILLGAGHYNKILATTNIHRNNHLQSQHISAEYSYAKNSFQLKGAAFYKHEKYQYSLWSILNSTVLGLKEKNVYGLEIFAQYNIDDTWQINASNIYLQTQSVDGVKLNPSLNYFLKASILYSHPKLGALTLAYVNRPGQYYNFIDTGVFSEELNDFVPLYDESFVFNQDQYPVYQNLTLSYSKYFLISARTAMVTYLSVNNVLNHKNIESVYYNTDYTAHYHNTYQPFAIYMGALVKLKR